MAPEPASWCLQLLACLLLLAYGSFYLCGCTGLALSGEGLAGYSCACSGCIEKCCTIVWKPAITTTHSMRSRIVHVGCGCTHKLQAGAAWLQRMLVPALL